MDDRTVYGRLCFLVLSLFLAAPARAADLPAALRALGASDPARVQAAVTALGDRGDPAALRALEALYDDRLKVAPDGAVYVSEGRPPTLTDPISGAPVTARGPFRDGEMNNELRRVVLPVIAKLKLGSPDPALRLAAAQELSRRGEGATLLLRKALAGESDPRVKDALALGLAELDVASANADTRLAAAQTIAALGASSHRGTLERLVADPDPRIRTAVGAALAGAKRREMAYGAVGHALYGLSLASVFLFAALGLAITFGVMGVINMAHGEMLTIGAYTTFVMQSIFKASFPSLGAYYLVAAIPAAFLAAAAVGVLLERTVIRWLYGRPLETLLATWGVSLVLIQTIRLVFGASNVAVANPPWLAGGVELLPGLSLAWNRIGVVLFVVFAALLVWFLLQRTSLGLEVRAVTQNRAMAACMGVRTGRVDMWTFALGSGVAGLGGVALSQLGNVGPELGQTYILDSFMVVVLGGVGRIAGAVAAALGLGITQKLIEPLSGAVLGKIAVLTFIILFIQRRPQGIFPQRGRVEV